MSYPTLSISDIRSFKRCRRQWDWKSRHRQGLSPVKPQKALYMGRGVHHALDEYYSNNSDPASVYHQWATEEKARIIEEAPEGELWPEDLDALDEVRDLGISMLEDYVDWAQVNDPESWETMLVTEQPFLVPIYTPNGNRAHCNLFGIMDGVVQDEYGAYWIHEIKTAKNISTDHLDMDEQAVAYLYAARELWGIDCEGIIYTFLRKKSPTVPKELKSGGISQAKNIATTHRVYVQTLIEYYQGKDNVPWDEYSEILTQLKNQDNPFFERHRLRKTKHEIDNFGQRLYDTYRDMLGKPRIYPNPTRDCSWDCSFRDVCLQKNDGSDYKFTLKNLFKERDDLKDIENILTIENSDVSLFTPQGA